MRKLAGVRRDRRRPGASPPRWPRRSSSAALGRPSHRAQQIHAHEAHERRRRASQTGRKRSQALRSVHQTAVSRSRSPSLGRARARPSSRPPSLGRVACGCRHSRRRPEAGVFAAIGRPEAAAPLRRSSRRSPSPSSSVSSCSTRTAARRTARGGCGGERWRRCAGPTRHVAHALGLGARSSARRWSHADATRSHAKRQLRIRKLRHAPLQRAHAVVAGAEVEARPG